MAFIHYLFIYIVAAGSVSILILLTYFAHPRVAAMLLFAPPVVGVAMCIAVYLNV